MQRGQRRTPGQCFFNLSGVTSHAEADSDEVYAQIMLQPEADQSELTSLDPELQDLEKCTAHSFCKTLTASDTSTHAVSLFLGGMLKNAFLSWTCLRIHHVKNWLPKISMELSGISVTSFVDNLGGICLQPVGVSLLAQKDWLLAMHLSS